jgi:hypothetical protein
LLLEMAELPLHGSTTAAPLVPRTSTSSNSSSTSPSQLHIRSGEYDDEDEALADADALLASEEDGKVPQRARAGSFSFAFSPHLLQLAASSDERREEVAGGGNGRVKEHVSLAHGVALVVGTVIGSGIFSSPGIVAKETGSVGSALLVWVGAGLLSWAGAYCLLSVRKEETLTSLSLSRRFVVC